ncbi:MAG TPA: beta-propeller fold lactonase family protein [Polyangiaceae bacterium]|nr:beta-propeller fold lactonase family protein [Polyangiaceae bacterium]
MFRGRHLVAALVVLSSCSRKPPPVAKHVFVSDEAGGDVVAIDLAKGEVVARIPVGKRPRGLKPSPDGRWLYVALSGSPRAGPGVDESKLPPGDRSADGIGLIDLETMQPARTLTSGQDPETFDLAPDGKTLFVSNEETAEMSAIDLESARIRGKASVGHEPEGVTVRPDGKVVFVTSEADAEVTAVDTSTLAVLGHVPTGKRPRAVVVARDGVTAFATNEGDGSLTVFDAVAFAPRGTIPLHEDSPMPSGPRPMGAVLSPDGKTLYVSCGRGGSIAVVDVASRTQTRSIDGVGDRPWGIAISADGARLYTANGSSHDLAVVNAATGNVEKRVVVGGLPWGATLGP